MLVKKACNSLNGCWFFGKRMGHLGNIIASHIGSPTFLNSSFVLQY